MEDPDATVHVSDRRLAQYAIVRQVGAGAMGIVYEARDTDLNRRVAIKLLKATEEAPDEAISSRERFLREARTAAQLTHPNVAVIYQVGRHQGQRFIAMEWLDGVDLGRRVAEHGPMPWAEAVAAIRDAAAGLAAAHAQGLVHRDIKPSNLMQTPEGTVKVVDFGLARWHGVASELTVAGSLIGTPTYMSPEQCRGEEASTASDQYALACTLFYLLSGRPPFEAPNMSGVLEKQVVEAMPDVRAWVPDIPEGVVQILMRGAAKQPAERFPDAQSMLAELRAVLGPQRRTAGAALDLPRQRAAGSPTSSSIPSSIPSPIPSPPPSAHEAGAARPPPGNLPADATSLVGREEISARALALLGQSRLLTLTGPGGTGKTRLALQLARELAPDYADGAWFVELAAVPAGDEIEQTLAAALGVPEVPGRARAASIVEHLRARQIFIVLDSCDHVIDSAAASARQLIAAAPRLHLLATSRQALGVPGETVLGVPTLALPEDDRRPEALIASQAGQLFAARAHAVRPDFVVDDSNADAVAEICRRLDGLPLAIELAAARVKVLSPAQIASRLDSALELLTGGQRSLLPRQRTLRALIDWSYDLLEARHRQLLQGLAVFSGGFDLEAAEAVLPDDEAGRGYVLDELSDLVDRSLVVASEHEAGMRYHLLETIRQYAERLSNDEARIALRRRHAEHYTHWVQGAVARLDGAEHAHAAADIAREAKNARAALEAAITQRWFDIGLPLANALASYWLSSKCGSATSLDPCGGRAERSPTLASIERLVALAPEPSAELARLVQRGGMLELCAERHGPARAWLERGLAIARTLADAGLESELLHGLGSIALREENLDRAAECFLGSVEASRRAGQRMFEARALNDLAAVATQGRQYDVARSHFQSCLQIQRELGSQRDQAETLRSLAVVESDLGNAAPSDAHFEASLRISQALGDHWGAACTRWQLGRCKLAGGDLAGARASLQLALADSGRFDDRLMLTQMLDLLAIVLQRQGLPEESVRLAQRSLALRRAPESQEDVALSLVTFAELHLESDPSHSARLLGCAAALGARRGAKLPPRKQAEIDAVATAVAATMSAADFDRLFGEGKELDPCALLDDV